MPKNKSFEDRKKILNQMFRTRAYTLDELIKRVEENLGVSISKKTIQNDIRFIRTEAENQGALLKCLDSRYSYDPKNFNLFEVKVDPASIEKIKLATSILKQIPGLDLHEDLKEVFDKLEMRVGSHEEQEQPFIQFDTRPDYQGSKYLAEILAAIEGRTVISFDYQPFTYDKPVHLIVHPYLLKEYNNRWFLIGMPENLRQQKLYLFHQYGLERIKSKIVPEIKIEYYMHHKFDAITLYKNIVGISLPQDGKKEIVVLRFSPTRAKYVETNPLHHSQTLVKGTTYSYELIPNKELQSLILSYGVDVEVMKPKGLRGDIAMLLSEAAKRYNLRCK